MSISALILSKNEEKNIEGCIKSVSFCDEIIVIDDYSSDKTEQIAKKLGAAFYKHHLSSDYSQQRNYALEKAKAKWCLFIDPDERVTPGLAKEIQNETKSELNNTNGFYIRRKDIFKDQKMNYGEVGSFYILRLAKKGAGKWKREVHEHWDIFGRKRKLKNTLLHYSHPKISDFVRNVNIFSTLHAKANYNEHKKSSVFKIIFMPVVKFAVNYFFKLGFLDKDKGLIYAFMMSLHSFLAWSKLWIYQKSNSQK